jgi:hypothetical protein
MMVTILPRTLVRPLLLLLITAALLTTTAVTLPASADAAAIDAPVAQETVLPMTPGGEGGGGLDGSGAPQWIMFAIALGPFLVLISTLLWLTVKIDASTGADQDDD